MYTAVIFAVLKKKNPKKNLVIFSKLITWKLRTAYVSFFPYLAVDCNNSYKINVGKYDTSRAFHFR